MPSASAPVTVRRDRMYNVLDFGLKADGVTSNTTTLVNLVDTVRAAGGGDIYIPRGDYAFGIDYNGAASPANRSVYLRSLGRANIRFIGDGEGSRLIWGGNAGQGGGGGGAAHAIYVRGRTSHITFEGFKILQSNLTNPDPGAEQHHLIRLQADVDGNTQFIKFQDVDFGLVKGDAVNVSGGFDVNAIHGSINGSQGSGAITSLTNTAPSQLLPGEGQRVCVSFSGAWDGGTFTFVGTEPNGRVISETIAKLNAVGADTVSGYRLFRTITSVTKNSGGTAGTATLGWSYWVQNCQMVNCRFNGFDRAGLDPGYGYRSGLGVQRMSSIEVVGCYFTGSDDQLVDFEPTGNGPLGPFIFDRCTFDAVAVAPLGGADTGMSFFGNANLFPCERSTITNCNFLGCGLIGGKLNQCDILNNHFWIPEDTRLGMQFTDRMEDVRIQGNTFEALGPNVGDVTAPCISMIGGGSTTVPDSPRGVQILDNICHWYALAAPNQQPAIRMTVGTDCVIARNTLINHGTASAVDVAAIKLEDAAIAVKNMRIEGNAIEGARGGGSIQRGVDIVTRPSTNWTNLTICNNVGTGVTSKGVNLRNPNAGSYVNPPSVWGNRFPDATNNVVAESGVLYLIGGNGGDSAGQYTASGTDPAQIAALNDVGIGSTFQSSGTGGDLYLKTAANAAGWKKVTRAG